MTFEDFVKYLSLILPLFGTFFIILFTYLQNSGRRLHDAMESAVRLSQRLDELESERMGMTQQIITLQKRVDYLSRENEDLRVRLGLPLPGPVE